jgi:hypothetical protein
MIPYEMADENTFLVHILKSKSKVSQKARETTNAQAAFEGRRDRAFAFDLIPVSSIIDRIYYPPCFQFLFIICPLTEELSCR